MWGRKETRTPDSFSAYPRGFERDEFFRHPVQFFNAKSKSFQVIDLCCYKEVCVKTSKNKQV